MIISWDDRCKASEEWVSAMGIQNLNRGIDQPFYHVLSDDGTSRYVAEGKSYSEISNISKLSLYITSIRVCR